ncbi:glycoside hydrolase family 65 protein, partial [Lacticaseibacillus paracasei]
PAYFGKAINAPSFLPIRIKVNEQPVDLAKNSFRDFYLALDLHQGLLTRQFIYEGDQVEVRFEFQRFLSNVVKEAALINVKATVLS